MLNLFRGEVYRLFHKRNMYVFIGVVLLGYVAVLIMRSGGYDHESVLSEIGNAFMLMPALLGGYLFTSIYSDDLSSKNLITLVGYGTSRLRIVLTKLLVMVLFTIGLYALLTLLHLAVFALLGLGATGALVGYVWAVTLQGLLLTIGFSAVASIVVYGTQKPTFAAVTFFLLAFNVVTMLVGAASRAVGLDLSSRLLSGTTGNILLGLISTASPVLAPAIEFLAYVVLAVIASVLVFRHREMEF